MADSPSVYLLILTWNARATLMECLESVFELQYPNFKVVVMDNGSEDDTVEVVRREYGDRLHLIENGGNIRFSRGNNAGIEYALKQKADYLILLNDDIAVAPDMIDELVKVAESDPKIGVVGPKIYYWQPRDQIWFAGGLVHFHKGTTEHIGIRERDTGQYDKVRDVDYITGCAMMGRREVFEKVGLLDPAYLAYYEDSDWCMRAARAGYRMVYVPSAKMWHKISASTGGQLTKYKVKHKLRSGWIFYRRYGRWYHFFTIPFFQIIDAIRVLLLVLGGRMKDTYK